MALSSYSIPNLIQGISQQSDAQRDPSQGEIQVNGFSSLTDGLRKRAGTSVVKLLSSTSLGDVAFHSILRDAGERYLVVISKTAVRVFDLDGNEKTVSAPSGYGYLSTVVSCSTDIRASTIADFTFISSVRRAPAMTAALAPATARPAANEALVWVKAANYGQTYRLSVNGTLATVTTPVQSVTTSGTTVTENRISTADIANELKTSLAGVTGVSIAREGSVLHVTSASAITISATDARSNADITAITDRVQIFNELPTIAPRGYTVQVAGDPSSQYTGYYVAFLPRNSTASMGEGTWEECVAPGMPYQLDAATMPQILVRLPDASFYFGPANGSTQGGLKMPAWGQRTAGDYVTAPDPSFIGYPIEDMFIQENRIGILSDENQILSRARSFFDFFPETVTQILATDPIDKAAGGNRISVLRHAFTVQDELLLFSEQQQFRASAEGAFTPESTRINTLTSYEVDCSVRPLQVAGGIVFAQVANGWTQFREFSLRGAGTAVVGIAPSVTDHVPTFIPGSVRQLTGNDTAGVWFAITNAIGAQNRIYVFKYADRSTGTTIERVQRSWSYWELKGASKILQILCLLETLYLVTEYPSGAVMLEKMPVSDRLTTDALTTLLLDRQVTTTTATPPGLRVASGTYNAVSNTTTWTLPFAVAAPTQAWTLYGTGQSGGELLGTISSGNTITAWGNYASTDVVFGETIEFRYRFSRFKLMEQIGGGRVASNVARTQVRNAKLRYHDSRYFRVLVTPERRSTVAYVWNGWQLGVRNSQLGSQLGQGLDFEDRQFAEGVFTVPIQSRGETCLVEIVNDTPGPCMFSSCDWVAQVTSKEQRLQ